MVFEVATRMHKQFQEDRYIYWSVIGAILQVRTSVIMLRRICF